jgi:hypothetical protein
MIIGSAERGRHHRHAAGHADRRPAIVIHALSIPVVAATVESVS